MTSKQKREAAQLAEQYDVATLTAALAKAMEMPGPMAGVDLGVVRRARFKTPIVGDDDEFLEIEVSGRAMGVDVRAGRSQLRVLPVAANVITVMVPR